MLSNYHHYQSVSLTRTLAGMCTPNVEFWGQLGMQSIYGQHHALLFNTAMPTGIGCNTAAHS